MVKYLQMDGVDDFASTNFKIPIDFILEVDFISNNLSAERVIVAQYSTDVGRFLFNTQADGRVRVFLGGLSNFVSTNPLTLGTRYKLKLVMQNKTASLYINNILDKQFTFTGTITQNPTMYIGRINNGSSYFNGNLYSIKVSDQSSNILVYYDMSTGTVQDQSGNGNHAALNGGTWLDDGTGGIPTGTDGSITFDLKQIIYSDSLFTADTKLSLYSDSSTITDTKQSLYQDCSFASDSKQLIYSDSSLAYDSKQILFNDSFTIFDTLQEFFSDGIVGSTPFDIRLALYSDSQSVFDSQQAFFTNGLYFADLTQQIYVSGATIADTKLAIYIDGLSSHDTKQSLYSDGLVNADMAQRYFADSSITFDTLQAILEEWTQYSEVIRIILNISREQGETLAVSRKRTASLEITQQMQSELKM